MAKVLVINGPNLDLLGKREPDVYGDETIDMINEEIKKMGKSEGVKIEFYQSNHEGDIVDKIGATDADGILIIPLH